MYDSGGSFVPTLSLSSPVLYSLHIGALEYSGPPCPWFHLPWFLLPSVNHGSKILNGIIQKQAIHKH